MREMENEVREEYEKEKAVFDITPTHTRVHMPTHTLTRGHARTIHTHIHTYIHTSSDSSSPILHTTINAFPISIHFISFYLE